MKSWGNIYNTKNSKVLEINDFNKISLSNPNSYLPYGLGRSYGDSCLNSDGIYLDTSNCKKILNYDEKNGVVECESGITVGELSKLTMPEWFVPVSPGTKFVTIGGAIANDVHGKNHHANGTFGMHVISFELIRSSGEVLFCDKKNNYELFKATIGGLGLTGLISKVKIQLTKSGSYYIDQETIKFKSLVQYFDISDKFDSLYDYSVAWVDCINGNEVRGVYMGGNFSKNKGKDKKFKLKLSVPFYFPYKLLNNFTIRIFNIFYYYLTKSGYSKIFYENFFYPLDSIHNWNKIYSKKGFYQFQFVIDKSKKNELQKIFNEIKEEGIGSFLAVLKTFGNLKSPGMLSFPKEGYTLALDFPNHGEKTVKFLNKMEKKIISIGGKIYPAKDILMSPESFHKSYETRDFINYKDKNFKSDMSIRLKI